MGKEEEMEVGEMVEETAEEKAEEKEEEEKEPAEVKVGETEVVTEEEKNYKTEL